MEVLNGGYVKYVDPDSGCPYFFCDASGESTYDRPAGFQTVADPFASASSNTVVATPATPAGVLSVRRDEDQKPVEVLNGGWAK